MKDDTKYDLTEEEYNRSLILAEMATFMNAYRSKDPKSIFVIAQPGAGKTALKAYISNSLQANREIINPVEFNPDEISTHHLYYKEIMNEFSDDSYRILQRFTQPALDNYLRQRAVELRCDILQEGTFASTQGYIDLIKFQRNGGEAKIGDLQEDKTRKNKTVQGGYNVRIYCLAVNRFESLLSCLEREQFFREHNLAPRVVTIENHDRAYKNMLNTLDLIEKDKLFDKLQIFKRGTKEEQPELILDYDEKNRQYQRISEYVVSERKRQEQELFKNPERYIARINDLKLRVKKNPKYESILNRIERVEELFKNELEKENQINEEH